MTGSFNSLANPWVAGLPIYEPGRPIEEVARELGFSSADEIDKLASNENALGPAPRAIEAMRQQAVEMHRYPDGGAYYLKRALADRLDVEPTQILPTNGSNEALELLGHTFLGEGVGIVMANTAFVVYRLIAAAARSDVVAVPMQNYTHDLDAMLKAVTPQTRIVFIANPNNPTGTIVTPEAIERFMDDVPDTTVVCFDEAYIELLPDDAKPDCLRYVREGRNVVVLRTFSKVYGLAGLRIGYAVAPEECMALLNRVRQPFNANAMALAAAEAALGDEAHVERTRRKVREGLAFLEKELARAAIPFVPAVTNFMLVEVGEGRKIFGELQTKGVIVRPMDGYGLPNHVRVTVGTHAQNERFVRELKAVLA